MKRLAVLLLAVVALGVSGCGGDDDSERTGAEQPTAASGEVPFDRAFIDAMVPHHQAAIEMADAGDIVAAQQREIDLIETYFQGAHG